MTNQHDPDGPVPPDTSVCCGRRPPARPGAAQTPATMLCPTPPSPISPICSAIPAPTPATPPRPYRRVAAPADRCGRYSGASAAQRRTACWSDVRPPPVRSTRRQHPGQAAGTGSGQADPHLGPGRAAGLHHRTDRLLRAQRQQDRRHAGGADRRYRRRQLSVGGFRWSSGPDRQGEAGPAYGRLRRPAHRHDHVAARAEPGHADPDLDSA